MRDKLLEMKLLSQKLINLTVPNFSQPMFPQIITLHQWMNFIITLGTVCFTCTNDSMCASFILISFCFVVVGHLTQVLPVLDEHSITESFLTSFVSHHYLKSIANPVYLFMFVCCLWTWLNIYLCDLKLLYFFSWELSVCVFCSFFPSSCW